MAEKAWVIFDGPPEHEAGRFVEVENGNAHSVSMGAWHDRRDGYWSLGPFVCAVAHEHETSTKDAEIARLTEQRDALLAACQDAIDDLEAVEDGYADYAADPNDAISKAMDRAAEVRKYLRAALLRARGGDHA